MSLPIGFKEFVKEPVKAVLFLALVAVIFLYIENRTTYKNQIDSQEERIEKLEEQVSELQDKLIDCLNESKR